MRRSYDPMCFLEYRKVGHRQGKMHFPHPRRMRRDLKGTTKPYAVLSRIWHTSSAFFSRDSKALRQTSCDFGEWLKGDDLCVRQLF